MVGVGVWAGACATGEDPVPPEPDGGASQGGSSGAINGGAVFGGMPTFAGTGPAMAGRGGSAGAPATGGSAGLATSGAGGSTGGTTASGGSSGMGTGGSMGTGARAACDWTGAACASKTCDAICGPSPSANYCRSDCPKVINCVKAAPATCATDMDPMCVLPKGPTSMANSCTMEWYSASGSTPTAGTPAAAAVAYFECACGVDVPGIGSTGTGGTATGTGGAATGGKGGTGGV